VPDRPSSREDSLWSNPPNTTSQARDVWEKLDTIPAIIPNEVPTLQKLFALGDDNDSTTMFTTVHRIGASHETTPLVLSSDIGDGDQSETGAQKGDHLEEEPLDYEPSPLREKDVKKSHHQDDDVYSLSRLSPP
jgi:hypothetical protein